MSDYDPEKYGGLFLINLTREITTNCLLMPYVLSGIRTRIFGIQHVCKPRGPQVYQPIAVMC